MQRGVMYVPGFEIGEELGGGGEYLLCRARRERDGRSVLLKSAANGIGSDAHARALLERELEICRDLGIGGVLTALDLLEHGGRPLQAS